MNKGEDVQELPEEETASMKQINEEYKIWKKNAPFLYDMVITHALEWPSLTVDWLQKSTTLEGNKACVEQELVLGTHTTEEGQNHLMIHRVRLPNEDTPISVRSYDDERGELGTYGGFESKIENKVRINHDQEVNRARHMPQDDYVIATKTNSGDVHVFFVRQHESVPASDGPAKPDIRLSGHEREGYGLDWSRLEKGKIVSGSDDSVVCIWDINAPAASNGPEQGLAPLHKFKAHNSVIGDVQFHKGHRDIFASVGDDKRLNIWDLRDLNKPKASVVAHEKEAQTLSMSPFNDFLTLTGGSEGVIKLWDNRKLQNPIHIFQGHSDEIYNVEWAPFNEAIMASCGADRRVLVWDLSRIGQEQSAEDAEDGPPELLFIHGGHTAKVSDFSWNLNEDWMIASVAEDNILQIWQIAANICNEDPATAGASMATNLKDEDLE